ncbi:YAP5 and YAP7 protein [Rutstroemia sp. NJR-2017a WRK4]|nr:YAP5 and YAP7 protein [Rutstroemia sp. NJR-2017a WRK4]
MAIASPMWFSPQSSSVSVDRELPGDMSGMDSFESGYSYPMDSMIPPMQSTYSIPPYSTRYISTMNMPMVPQLAQSISTDDGHRDVSSERGEEIEAELARTKGSRSSQRKPREKKSVAQGVRTRETSHDSTDSVSEKTPAQKMRRLVQNRVSQRNFRKRQANERMRLEEQVKMLSSELHSLSDAYQDLLRRFEQVHRENSVANSEVISSWMGDSGSMGPFNMTTGLE